MPKMMAATDDQIINIPGAGGFQFSAVRIEDLGATEYTLVTIVCDISGSVIPFADSLLECIKSIITACQKSPRAENLLIRLLHFRWAMAGSGCPGTMTASILEKESSDML